MGGKKPKTPKAPDYKALAEQQAKIDEAAFYRELEANRANEVDPYGTLTWSKDPTTGQWTKTEALNEDAAATLRAQQNAQRALAETGQGLLGRAQSSVDQPFSYEGMEGIESFNPAALPDYEGLPDFGKIDMSQVDDWSRFDPSQLNQMDPGFGAVQEVSDAMMGRLQPGLDTARNRELQRLKAQGLTEGSQAMQDAQFQLARQQSDAERGALLAGAQEYGNIFQRGLDKSSAQMRASQLANALRGQQFGEQGVLADEATRLREGLLGEQVQRMNLGNVSQLTKRGADTADRGRQIQEALALRQMPLNEFNAFMSGTQIQNPTFGGYATGSGLEGADLEGAAQNQYQAAIDRYNAKAAGASNKTAGALGGAASGAATGAALGPWGAVAGGLIGGAMGYFS